MTLKVESYDNRGTVDCPFGFVYFNDDIRVCYAPGVNRDNELGGSNWGEPTLQHYDLTVEFLAREGVVKREAWKTPRYAVDTYISQTG